MPWLAKGRLGALLIQFPVSFKNTSLNREYIERLVRQFIEYPCVIEVRDSSWDNPETLETFAQRNVAFCNIDQPLLGKSLGPTEHVTAPIAYIRLHGRNYDQWFDSTIATTATTTSTKSASWKVGKSASRMSRTRRRPRT